jgi:hypothetical protein
MLFSAQSQLPPSASLDALACGYCARVRNNKVFVIMHTFSERDRYQTFIDESAGDEPGRILLMSGCIQLYPAWTQFTEDWQTVLDSPPTIHHFHMTEARSLTGEFAGWKSIERDLKVIALTDVIMRCKPHVVSCWLSRDAFDKTMRGAVPHDLRHAYFTCFQAIVQTVAEYQGVRGITTPPDYIFDNQGDIGMEAQLWYAAMKDTAPAHIRKLMGSTPIFRDDKQVLPLQAADVIAWHKRRRKEYPGLDSEVAASLRVDELPGAERNITDECLGSIARDISEVPHVQEFREKPSLYQQLKRQLRKQQRRDRNKK